MRSWSTAAPASLPSPSGESSAVLSLEIHWIAPRRSLRRSGVSGILALAAAFNGWRLACFEVACVWALDLFRSHMKRSILWCRVHNLQSPHTHTHTRLLLSVWVQTSKTVLPLPAWVNTAKSGFNRPSIQNFHEHQKEGEGKRAK